MSSRQGGVVGQRMVASRSLRSRVRRNNNADVVVEKHDSRFRKVDVASIPTFKDFLQRQTVLRQYRGYLRTLSGIDDLAWQKQLKKDVSDSYKRNRGEMDPTAIKMCMREGERQLAQLRSIVGDSNKKSSSIPNKASDLHNRNDPDSWINIPDKQDPRGRVGTHWPWQR